MKNQKILILTSALLLAGLVGCNKPTSSSEQVSTNPPSSSEPAPSTSSSEEEKEMTVEEAEAIIAEFDTSLTGTVKATYHAQYDLDVESESASARAFAEEVDKTVTIEADYTAGSLYLYVGYTVGEEKTEALVYEDNETYYYLETTLGDPIALTNEAAALAKMEELVAKVSKTKAGWVDSGTFLYTGTMAYEHSQFLLDSTNVELEFLDDTRSFEENDKGGLTITSSLEYVGYTTDGGTSELSPKDDSEGKVGANIVVTTDDKGHVVSFTSTYDEAQLEMPIMTPAPLLTLTGSHSFEAEYGATLTKKTTIDHEATFGTVTLPAVTTKGYAEVFYCKPEQADLGNKKPVSATTEIPVGHWIIVKVTAAEGNNVEAVTYAGNSQTLIPPAYAGGMYCFAAIPGENAIGVNISGSAALPEVCTATASVKEGSHATITGPVGFTLAGQNPSAWDYVAADGFAYGSDKWVAIGVTADEGYEVSSVKVNGEVAPLIMGYYCVNAKLPKAYSFVVETRELSPVITVTAPEGVTYEACTFDVVGYGVQNMAPVVDNKAIVGSWVGFTVTAPAGQKVAGVTVNGQSAMFMSGQYCYNVKTADPLDVKVYTVSETATNVLKFDGCQNANVTIDTCVYGGFANRTVVVSGCELTVGEYVCVKVTPAAGYELVSVTCNGSDVTAVPPAAAGGLYCFAIAEGTTTIAVTVAPVAA